MLCLRTAEESVLEDTWNIVLTAIVIPKRSQASL